MILPLRAGLALAGGFLGYITWYRITVGKFCPAMWGGTAPPVIILVGAVFVWRISRLLRPEDEW